MESETNFKEFMSMLWGDVTQTPDEVRAIQLWKQWVFGIV